MHSLCYYIRVFRTLLQMFQKITEKDINYWRTVVGEQYVLLDNEDLLAVSKDETENLVYVPEAVVQPHNADEISLLLKYCNEHKIPVTTRGAGTGLSGGALAVAGGLVLDTKRLNKIVGIDTDNFQVTVEPGVITQELQDAVKEKGLFYPPDPASKGSCFIGGNVAENSGGPKAVKYGVVKDYVLNLEVVLADGTIMWTGANVLKNATGYNLTQLIVGSEGTLAVITKIVLRLIPAPQFDMLVLVPFKSATAACEAVNKIMLSGVIPSGLEFMERDAIEWTMRHMDSSVISLTDDVQAHLLIEVDGNERDVLYKEVEQINNVLETFDIGEVLFADSHQQKQALWSVRRKVGEAVKSYSIYKEEDTVVPRAKLPELLQTVKMLGEKHGFQSVCYGHAGDGNLHVNIIKGDMSDDDWNTKLSEGIAELFKAVVGMGGTLSGEHGIGWVQKQYMHIAFSKAHIALMKQIKTSFDPNGILNPLKVLPE